jgi:hypothetical protein
VLINKYLCLSPNVLSGPTMPDDRRPGRISSYWHVEGKRLLYDVPFSPNISADLVPPNTQREVTLSGLPIPGS